MATPDPVCPVCASRGGLRQVEFRDPYRILGCGACGLEFSNPMVYNPGIYSSAYGSGAGPEELKNTGGVDYKTLLAESARITHRKGAFQFPLYRRIVLRDVQCVALDWLRHTQPRGARILDLGCGTGLFLAALGACGFTPVGVDVAAVACKQLREAGFEIYSGTLRDYPEHASPPTAVTFFELLEHLDDPVGLLKDIRSRFPGASIIFSVPSPRRVSLLRGRESWDYPPHHLTRWSGKAARIAIERAGFRLETIRFLPPAPTDFTGTGLGRLMRVLRRPWEPASAGLAWSLEPSTDLNTPAWLAAVWIGKAILLFPWIVLRYLQGFSSTSMCIIARPSS